MKILLLALVIAFASCSNGGGPEKGPENTPSNLMQKTDTVVVKKDLK